MNFDLGNRYDGFLRKSLMQPKMNPKEEVPEQKTEPKANNTANTVPQYPTGSNDREVVPKGSYNDPYFDPNSLKKPADEDPADSSEFINSHSDDFERPQTVYGPGPRDLGNGDISDKYESSVITDLSFNNTEAQEHAIQEFTDFINNFVETHHPPVGNNGKMYVPPAPGYFTAQVEAFKAESLQYIDENVDCKALMVDEQSLKSEIASLFDQALDVGNTNLDDLGNQLLQLFKDAVQPRIVPGGDINPGDYIYDNIYDNRNSPYIQPGDTTESGDVSSAGNTSGTPKVNSQYKTTVIFVASLEASSLTDADKAKYIIPYGGDSSGMFVLNSDAIEQDFPSEEYGQITTLEELEAAIAKKNENSSPSVSFSQPTAKAEVRTENSTVSPKAQQRTLNADSLRKSSRFLR